MELAYHLQKKKMIQTAEKIIQELKYKKCELVLPLDIVCANSLNGKKEAKTFRVDCCQDKMILDIEYSLKKT